MAKYPPSIRAKSCTPSRFKAIGADRAEDVHAGRIEIGVEERVAEIAHDEGGAVDEMPQPLAAAHDADCRNQLVALAAQGDELGARRRAVGGLVEPGAVAHQHLVGADDEGIGVAAGDAQRLRLGKRIGAFGDVEALGVNAALISASSIAAGATVKETPARRSSSARAGAGRGEDEGRRAHASVPCRRASSLRIAAAVSSMERRDTSITGQWFARKAVAPA